MTPSTQAAIQPRFRTVDGLSIRYAESGDPGRGEHALLLSPWPESLYAWRRIVGEVMGTLERYTATDTAREDYLASYEGDRFAESMAYVRAYPADVPALGALLPQVRTPALVIGGRRDDVVPPVNAEFLHERLPRSELALLDSGHFTWEDAADEYAARVAAWWDGGWAAAGFAAA